MKPPMTAGYWPIVTSRASDRIILAVARSPCSVRIVRLVRPEVNVHDVSLVSLTVIPVTPMAVLTSSADSSRQRPPPGFGAPIVGSTMPDGRSIGGNVGMLIDGIANDG